MNLPDRRRAPMRRVWRRFLRVETTAEWAQALLLGAGMLLGAVTFWYKEMYLPGVSPATLTISPTLEEIGRQGDGVLIRASVNVANNSAYRVYVPAFWYTVRGVCYAPRAMAADSFAAVLKGWRGGGMQSRFDSASTGEMVAVGRPSPRYDTYYDPGSQRHYEELFVVPAARFSALRMEVNYMLAKDISGIARTEWRADSGRVADVVLISRRQREWPRFWASSLTVGRYDRRVDGAWRERAGAGIGWSHASLSLWQPGAAPQRCSGG